MKNKVFINNKFIDSKDAKVSVFDRGFLYGDGAFETMRSYKGLVFKLDEHMERLFKTLKALHIKIPYSKDYLKKITYKSLKINGLKDAYIRLCITRGDGRFGIAYKDKFKSGLIVISKQFEGYPAHLHSKGISAKIVKISQNERSALTGMKTLNYLLFIMARFEAQGKGFDDAILTNTEGCITEGATSNIFMVKGGIIITPGLDSGILPGITRRVVIDIAKKLGIKVAESHLRPEKLLKADEVFFTNSLAEILPVTRIGNKVLSGGRPGITTKALARSYRNIVNQSI